jgi:hypothetical protein
VGQEIGNSAALGVWDAKGSLHRRKTGVEGGGAIRATFEPCRAARPRVTCAPVSAPEKARAVQQHLAFSCGAAKGECRGTPQGRCCQELSRNASCDILSKLCNDNRRGLTSRVVCNPRAVSKPTSSMLIGPALHGSCCCGLDVHQRFGVARGRKRHQAWATGAKKGEPRWRVE